MDKPYPYEKKKKLATRIGRIRKKEDMKLIFNIIKEDNNVNPSCNDNGIFMLFNSLNDKTYYRLEKALLDINSRNKSEILSENSEKKEYIPYATDDFPAQEKLNPKLRYSNREKNLIKRQRHDENINSENSKDNVIYCDFNIDHTEDSENIQSES